MASKNRNTRIIRITLAVLCAFYLVLLIPDSEPVIPADDGAKQPFAWNQDQYWSLLENRFNEARRLGCDSLKDQIARGLDSTGVLISRLAGDTLQPDNSLFTLIETHLFDLTCLLAACPDSLSGFINLYTGMRYLLINQARRWDMNTPAARDRVYRLIYGGRTALEEIMLQAGPDKSPELTFGTDEPSATPAAKFMDVAIHSGDILVSRGGAPTSALIARGNDYPGNFSHAALVHIDDGTGKISIIESHIEIGVAIADVEKYLKDTKLRIMVLRLRSDHPSLETDPELPHKAAEYAMARAKAGHIPYDFAMDISEPSKLFCSEVVSDAYGAQGVNLWAGLSHISSPGVRNWLAAFGVRNFTTQEPSDLEYDPQLQVVAEWRDFETLWQDRMDNAVVDVMLEDAERGMKLKYNRLMLPLARVLKLYSSILNRFGQAGPVPEGMNATVALKNEWFSGRHRQIKKRLEVLAGQFREKNAYLPPYWELVKLARQAKDSIYSS